MGYASQTMGPILPEERAGALLRLSLYFILNLHEKFDPLALGKQSNESCYFFTPLDITFSPPNRLQPGYRKQRRANATADGRCAYPSPNSHGDYHHNGHGRAAH